MDLDMETIGLRIKKRRKELNLTQTQVKQQTGISTGNMSEIENGNRAPSLISLHRLSKVLECSIDWIVTGNSSTEEKNIFSEIEDSNEKKLINGYRELSETDKEELLEIMHLKLRKLKGDSTKTSSPLVNTENNKIVI